MIENYNKIKVKIDVLLELEWNNCVNQFETRKYKLKDLITFSNTGADAIQKAPIVEYETNCRCVRVGDFTNNRNYNDWSYCDVKPSIFKQYQLKKDDILITRTASIGLTKFIYEDINAVYNNGIIRIRANNKIQPVILYLICCSKDFENHIKGIEGASSTRPNMKINHLLDYDVKIPSISAQNLIYDKLEKLMSQKETIINKTNKLVKIKDILLNKYFN